MPDTRTTLNLKHTSIHDYLLKSKNDVYSIMNSMPEETTSDIKHLPSTSTITSYQVKSTTTRNDDCHLLMKSSADYQNSILPVDDNQQNLSSPKINHPPTNQTIEIPTFSGTKFEDPGQWLDQILAFIEQQNINPGEQRDLAAGKLSGEALLWYRMNRLQIPDMQTFIHQFLLTYHSAPISTLTVNSTSKDLNRADVSHKAAPIEKITHTYDNIFKSFAEPNGISEPSFPFESSYQVLQSAKNEKVKLIPNFLGSENSVNWLTSLEQTAKALRLNDPQIYELATIKLSGPPQEWFYHQDEIDNLSSFKQAFLYAFPPPIQPTNIDYLAQLLARKQGETEPVGKFVQDINRLCLKLDNKISEQDKLQYLRRGLRPQLKHYALSITSLQDFFTVMQRHEQIEKETTSNQQSSSRSSQQQQNSFNRSMRKHYDYRQNPSSTSYGSFDHYPHQNPHHETTTQYDEKNNKICYQCNKLGHLQWDCPDNNASQQQQHFQQGSH
ncbi:unnamed protein product [Rotaria sp. Silwood2]|nr:unnamed protein product [Rotaria sp. Silwood2]CAF3093383.1 unnamed protein product [Rotaria sp. Silwood2]CAF3274905.1 unnamed protein product [Rotaria sp. Silwood2]CAF4416284.1 unnamed protein product [Rotaria sp. Silwood2]CAF4566720.1 unnamed protein product [Rotaria sp. Silwood2]